MDACHAHNISAATHGGWLSKWLHSVFLFTRKKGFGGKGRTNYFPIT